MNKIKIELNELEIEYVIEALDTRINYLYKFIYDDNNFIEQIKQIKQLKKEIIETFKAYKRGDI